MPPVSAERRVPFYDFQAQYAPLREEILAALTRVVDSQKLILGDDVEALERELAAWCGCRYAIGCGSGTDALLLALLASDVRPGDHVVTTPFTFFATAGAIALLGATPVFADIDPATFNLAPEAVARALAAHKGVKAVIAVDLFGGAADMDPIAALARDYGCTLIEDAAQAIGAEYHGRRAGSLGAIGCFSFYPTKNLGAYGEAGLLTTNRPELAERLAALRVYGSRRRYYHDEVGTNSRLDTLQAAVLRVKLGRLDGWTAARQRNAAAYDARLPEAVVRPRAASWQSRHVWNQYVIRSDRRDALKQHLAARGIATEIYYPLPLHRQKCFAHLPPASLPEAERASAEVLALPVYPELSPEDLAYVCECVAEFCAT